MIQFIIENKRTKTQSTNIGQLFQQRTTKDRDEQEQLALGHQQETLNQ